MPRARRYELPHHARYLTFSCYHRLQLFNNDAIKQVFVDALGLARDKHRFRLVAWVLMPEHVHLLIVPDLPEHPLSQILQTIKQRVSRAVLPRLRQLDAPILPRLTDPAGHTHFWQRGGGYDRNITQPEALSETIAYIHANPLRRELVSRTVDWPWSSARWYAGEDALVPIDGAR